MPACAEESMSEVWANRQLRRAGSVPGDIHSTSRSNGSLPSSPVSSSPPGASSPTHAPLSFSRSSTPSVSRRGSAHFASPGPSRPASPMVPVPDPERSILVKIIGWYPALLLRFAQHIVSTALYLLWSQLLLAGPTLWLSIWLWVFWKTIQLPLILVKWFLMLLTTPAAERGRKKRTVLVSCGSTIQALHLARNFYSAGARVVVCEVEGLFGLARFSTAVSKFYTVPRPSGERSQEYVQALCDIVRKEKASYYIPVSATNTAYFDALAKPHLEQLNCVVFCPGVKEIWILDDILEVLRRCHGNGIATPLFYPITSKEDIAKLYDSGLLRTGRYFMSSVGALGCRDRFKINLPPFRQEFRMPYEINEQRPWVIVQDLPGEHFLTCTTVKESHVVANVTCRVDRESGGLVPVEDEDINQWLRQFFSKLRVLRQVSGHVSFRFVVSEVSRTLVPVGCRVGVSLPYVCHTSVHPRLVWRPCRHFSRQASGPLVTDAGTYWMHEAVLSTLRRPSVAAVQRLIGTVLDKREALFVFWDPLPYCAYYHLQLPFRNVLGFVQGHNRQNGRNGFHRTMAAPAQ
ncbi:Uncharacterized protein GBIM_08169 [Gryllus bimaculatus]|nr:Uncharacterized protein GBIM_08169 [Gryllus bimaculatus]